MRPFCDYALSLQGALKSRVRQKINISHLRFTTEIKVDSVVKVQDSESAILKYPEARALPLSSPLSLSLTHTFTHTHTH